MSSDADDFKSTNDRRVGERRVSTDKKYDGPERRKSDHRRGERRKEPRE